jgi:putative ABC transport system permease protein
MPFFKKVRSFVRNLFLSRRVEVDLDQEVHAHLEMLTDEKMRAGLSPAEAQRAARIELGGIEQVKEQVREERLGNWLQSVTSDCRYGLRQLRKNPGFTAVAVLSLAVGIGANTAIFSVVNGVLLQPLPFPKQSQLLMLWEKDKDGLRSNTSWATFTDWNKLNHSFTGIAAVSFWTPTLVTGSDAENLIGFRVSANFFDVIGAKLEHGRTFLPAEDVRGNNFVVILSNGLWQRRFASDPNILGKPIQLGSRAYTVVGILPAGFPSVLSFDPRKTADLYTPLAYDASLPYACRDCRHLRTIARLKDSVSLLQADAEMNQISQNLFRQYPTEYSAPGVTLTSLKDYLVGDVRPVLWALLGSVGFVLLTACVNVAILLLAWATRRQREVALRSALGAGRTRTIRQFLTESLLLSLIGGALGLLLAAAGVALLQRMNLGNLPRLQNIQIDLWTMAFTLGVCVFTVLIFGLVPAIRASKLDPIDALKEGGKSTSGREHNSLRHLLVVSNVALALLLLVAAGLMMRSFVRLLDVKPGFESSHTLTLGLSLWGPAAQDAPAIGFYQQVLDRVRALPSVESAGVVSQLPLGGNLDMYGVHVEGKSSPNPEEDPSADRYSISPGYLSAMRIPLLRGRDFDDGDRAGSPLVVLVNDTAARQFWPGENPVGKRLKFGDAKGPWRTVVGLVGDVLHRGLDAPHTLQVYLPQPQFTDSGVILVVRSGRDPASLVSVLRGEIAAVNPQVPVSPVATMEEIVSASVANQRFAALLFVLFGVVALLLAACGIYGVISYGIAQRTHEIGIRMALGAHPREILGLILTQGTKLTMLGVVIGVAASLVLTRLMRSFLFEVSPMDPLTFASVAALLTFVALLASYIPARRAAQIDPMVSLRCD